MSNLQLILQSGIIQLVIVCVAIFAISLCFLRSKFDEKNKTIHLLYISGILSFLIVELLSYICVKSDTDGKTITSYVAFASTLSSLILSVVAIIYTIVTNKKGDGVYVKIENSVDKLMATSDKLDSVSAIISSSLTNFQGSLSHIEKISKDTNQAVKEMSSTVSINNFNEDGGNVSLDDVLAQIIKVGSAFGNLALLACCYSYRTKKDFDLNVVCKNAVEYSYGYLVSVSTLLFITININGLNVKVNNVDSKLEDFLKKFFMIQSADIIEMVREIQIYFGITDEFWKAASNN